MMRKLLLLFFTLPMTAFATCPDGTTPYLGPVRAGYAKNYVGQCVPLCGGGMTKLNTSVGTSSPLFSAKNTSPSIYVAVGDDVCYVDLLSGSGRGVNVAYNDNVYHTNNFAECPQTFTLSYDCGDGATSVAPGPREIEWGDLFVADGNTDACYKPGYIFGGWQNSGKTYTGNTYYQYLDKSDKTLTAQWSPASYAAAYTCGTCQAPYVTGSSTQYTSARYGNSVTVSNTMPSGCTNALGATLTGFKIQYADGTDTGETVLPGGTFTYKYDENIRLSPMWRENPKSFTLSYDCGDGASGMAPGSRTVKYQKLFVVGADIGTCERPGYYVSGWKIGSTSYDVGGYGIYSYDSDKTLTAQWSPASYAAAYTCGTCQAPYVTGSSTQYTSARYGNSVTASATKPSGCENKLNKKLLGYKILDSFGVDTGETVLPGGTFTYKYDENIRLSPIWEKDESREMYTLSYSCGDGATGTPPESRSVKFMGLFLPGNDIGTCQRPGYYVSGWKIGSTSYAVGGYGTWVYTDNQTLVPVWSPASYAAAYVCNNGITNSSYLSVKSGTSYTPGATVCTAPDGKQFVGYEIQFADGTPTGDIVASDAAFTFNYDDNIRLSAIWQ